MGRYDIELNPEDYPEGTPEQTLETQFRERLGLRAQDEVHITFREQ